MSIKLDLSEYFGAEAMEERRTREPRQYDTCMFLHRGKACGKPIRERTTSSVAGSSKCEEHSRQQNRE